MLVILHGDLLSSLVSAHSLVETPTSPHLRIIVLDSSSHSPHNQQSYQDQPWNVTVLPAHIRKQVLAQACIHRSLSSLMFLDTVTQPQSMGSIVPDIIHIKPTPLYSNAVLYHPMGLIRYLTESLTLNPLCTVIPTKGSLCFEKLIRDLENNGETYTVVECRTPLSRAKVRTNSLVKAHWIGMHMDLRLPHRVTVDMVGNVPQVKTGKVGSGRLSKMCVSCTTGGLHGALLIAETIIDSMGNERTARL